MRTRTLAAVSFTLFLLASAVSAADLPPNCVPRDKLTEQLIKQDRAPVVAGKTGDDKVFEIWSMPDLTNWLMVLTEKNGVSCVIGAGPKVQTAPYQGLNPRTNI